MLTRGECECLPEETANAQHYDSANSLLELKIFTGHFGVSGSRITSRTPRGTAAVARAKIISFSIWEPTILVRTCRI